MKLEFSQIQGMKKLAKGGQASVYQVPPGALHPQIQEPTAIKKYAPKVLAGNEESIESYLKTLIQERKNAPEDVSRTIDHYTIWPRVILYENGVACGFAMNLIPPRFTAHYHDVTGDESTDSNFDFIMNSDEVRRRLGLPVINALGRAKITLNLLQILSRMHQYDFVLGDISPNNILVYVDPVRQDQNRILLIDSDSFRKKGHIHPLKQPHTPNWFPPEAWAARQRRIELERNSGDLNQIMRCQAMEYIQNTHTDVYKICLAILRLYHDGEQRSSISESPAALARINRELNHSFAALVQQGLSATPAERPTAQDLLRCYSSMIRQKKGR